jgi:DNA-binding NarL/FixJ family response regulator
MATAPQAADEEDEMNDEEQPRVLLVDDHELFRTYVRRFLEEQGIQVVAEAGDAHAAVAAVAQQAPDVAVVDLGVRPINGLDAARRIASVNAAVKVIVHTDTTPSTLAQDAAALGAYAILDKSDPAGLLAAVRRAWAARSVTVAASA